MATARKTTADHEADAAAQISELRDAVASLAERVGEIASAEVGKARPRIRAAAMSAKDSAVSAYEGGLDAVGTASGAAADYARRAGVAVKDNPRTSLGIAVGVGAAAAVLVASRISPRGRSGWF